MFKQKQRKSFTTSNKYQEKIILMAFIPVWLILLALVFSLIVIREEIIKAGSSTHSVSMFLSWIHQWYAFIIVGLCALFILIVFLAFRISEDLLGAFTRIIPEMDAIIEGRLNKLITARPSDDLANDLLKRVNVFIQSYLERKK